MNALIFDLDNCLAPADEMGRAFYEPVYTAIRAENHGVVAEAELVAAFEECWRTPFDKVAETHGFTEAMRAAGWACFSQLEVTEPMNGYGDLNVLGRMSQPLFLVTSGFKRLQWSKVRALGLEQWFDEIYVDAIDAGGGEGKRPLFERILRAHGLKATDVVAVGDSETAELAVGRQLGMATIQTLRPGVRRTELATAHIETLFELETIQERLSS